MSRNTMKTTTTSTSTNKALTLAEYKHQRQNEMQQAFFELAKARKDTDRFFNTLYQELLYNQAEKAVYIALKARHEKSSLEFIEQLQNDQSNDKKARNNANICEQITKLESLKKSQIKGFLFYKARANKLTIDPLERALAYTLAKDLNKQAKTTQQQINTLTDTLDITLSDRADLVQVAIIQMLENEQTPAPITPTVLASYGVTTEEELNEEQKHQAQEQANFRKVINAVGRAINKLSHPDANNRHTTKAEPITKAQYNEYLYTYGIYDYNTNDLTLDNVKIPHTKKRTSASECYITIEERSTKTQKGYYKVTHYKTTSPYRYIEDFTDQDQDTETDPIYLKVANPIINTFEDIESIKYLCELAELTTDESLIIELYGQGLRYYDNKEDIIIYIANRLKISRATVYRRIDTIKEKLLPIAKGYNIIK